MGRATSAVCSPTTATTYQLHTSTFTCTMTGILTCIAVYLTPAKKEEPEVPVVVPAPAPAPEPASAPEPAPVVEEIAAPPAVAAVAAVEETAVVEATVVEEVVVASLPQEVEQVAEVEVLG